MVINAIPREIELFLIFPSSGSLQVSPLYGSGGGERECMGAVVLFLRALFKATLLVFVF